jgi:superfamily II DNA or RNA helicase
VGVGKTCTSISIAEGFKEYISNLGRRIVVLVKNKNIQQNFVNELLSRCTRQEYINDARRDILEAPVLTKADQVRKNDIISSAMKSINKQYQFITYGTFVNRVLGSKVFLKDNIGQNTNKTVKVNGQIKRKKSNNPLQDLNNCVIIVDEAHNVTNNDVYIALKTLLEKSYNYKLVLLTATPMYDNPKEVFELSNLLNVSSPDRQLPIRNDLFKSNDGSTPLAIKEQSQYVNGNVLKGGIIKITEQGLTSLSKALQGKVSYLKPNIDTNPKVITEGNNLLKNRLGSSNVVYCQMSSYQFKVYLQALAMDVKQDAKYDLSAIQNIFADENIKETSSVSKTSSLFKNSSDASTITYPNELFGKEGFINSSLKEVLASENLQKYSAKLFKLLQNVNQSPGNAFIFSNYVSFGGTSLLKEMFIVNGYKEYKSRQTEQEHYKSFIVFDDSTNPETREKLRRIFNSPENKTGKLIKVIIGSPIISEGITLKNVRQVHILEPSWNMSRINQIIGRAVRNFSHQDLEPADRTVSIYKYVSVHVSKKSTAKPFFIDREKYILSEEKDRSNKIVERMLKEISFDCQFNQSRNNYPPEFDHTAECDYTQCSFSCQVKSDNKLVDYSTYNMNLSFFDKYDIEFIMQILSKLFHTHFIWHIQDILIEIAKLEPNVSTKAIYKTLGHIVGNKTSFIDMHNRDGFIINKGPFYIFNPSNVDINSSIYSKTLDFSVETNKYTLDDFYKFMYGSEIAPTKEPSVTVTLPSPVSLSEEDKAFNETLINSNTIFGTFRQRGVKNNPYGPIDDKFRLVDMRSNTEQDDKRKNISGMWIGSYKKPDLVQVAKDLNIKTKRPLSDYDKAQLGTLIESFLREQNRVLK